MKYTVLMRDTNYVIKEMRKLANLTQEELAELAGVSRRYIISLEAAIPARAPRSVLMVLSERTGQPLEDLSKVYRDQYLDKSEVTISKLISLGVYSAILSTYNMQDVRYLIGELLEVDYEMTQIKFCELFPINPSSLSAFESGRRGIPTSLMRIFEKLQLSNKQIKDIISNTGYEL